jgi:hypothetical protein
MKKIVGLFIAGLIAVATARGGKVKVEAYMATGPEDEATTSFTSDATNIFVIFKTKGLKDGDKLHGVLIAEDVGDAAPANTKVLEKELAMDGDTDAGDFKFIKPTNGWPAGKYHVEIYVNDDLATKLKFTVKAAAKPKKNSDEEESSDE